MSDERSPPPHRFALGEAACTVVSDGPLSLGKIEDSFAGVPLADLHASMRSWGFAPEPLVFQQNVLVTDLAGERVVFDTGMGNSTLFGTTSGRLPGGLAAAGLAPESVTAICLTHAHSDHIFGLVADGLPVFPEARIVLTAQTLADWEMVAGGGIEGLPPGYAETCRSHLAAVRNRLEVCAEDGEPIPGIRVVPTPGHTLGHVSYRITSAGRNLFVTGDVVHHPALHLDHPRLEYLFDADRNLAVATRLAWLDRLAEEETLVLAYHFPFPGLGTLESRGPDAYGWRPA